MSDITRKLMGSPLPKGWDLANASFTGEPPISKFSVGSQEISPTGVTFKPDGTKMYVVGSGTDSVYEYNLSTAWDVTSASYNSVSFSLSGQDTSPQDITFKPDGTKMYVVGSANDSVYEYDLSTAWDLSTTSYNSVSFSVTAQEVTPTGTFFKPDGTKMYVVGSISDNVLEYNLSTAWDLSSASYSGVSFSVVNEDGAATACGFKSDGTKMYVLGGLSDTVYEYDLSTAWDVSTASYSSVSFSVTGQESSPTGVTFKPDGTKMYVVGAGTDSVYGYDLSTAWDISTASLIAPTTKYFPVSSEDASPFGLTFGPDGEKMYIVGRGNDTIYEYDLSTAWQVHTASYLQQLSLNAQDANPSEVGFKPDGTKMYMVGVATDNVYEYDLSTAWDISTASLLQSFSVNTQDRQPTSLSLKPDGTKMYVLGNRNDSVYEYDLSTAWDISSASYSSVSFSVRNEEGLPFGLAFKPDGTKMYVVGGSSDTVYEYDLSTAWDLSTASYNSVSFSVVNEENTPNALSFRPNGFSMYVVGDVSDAVWQYNLQG